MNRALMQLYSLWLRDLRHFLRQRSRVAGALGQPVILWLLLSAGFRDSFAHRGGLSYGDFLFPGVIVLIALFAAVFSTISVIEDRRSGFLQGVLAAPVPDAVIVLAKLCVGATLAVGQALLFFLLLPLTGVTPTLAALAASIPALILIGMMFTGIGLLLSWNMRSTQGFHAIMNLVLIPLWILSGAFFPADGAAVWMQWIIRFNPLHYPAVLFADTFSIGARHAAPAVTGIVPALAVTLILFGTVTYFSIRAVGSR